MFLRGLNQNQKSMFLTLAMKASEINQVVENCEKQLLLAYADEMGIELSMKSNLVFEELIVGLKDESTQKELNQIMFELVGMVVSDGEFDVDEKAFLDKVAAAFEIEWKKIDSMIESIKKYKDLMKQINFLMYE